MREQCPYCGSYWVKVDRIDFGELTAKRKVARMLKTHVLKGEAALTPAVREYSCETCRRSWSQPTLE
jgi:DNA-directed RNA polymerase subunit RPC12/RpoP